MLSADQVIVELREAVQRRLSAILCCRCEIHYSGRAESFLGSGDRILIIKPDGTLLVHQPSGSNPVNYMKEGTAYRLGKDEERIVLSCRNISLKEFMDILISKTYSFQTHLLEDNEKLQLAGSEKDMADMIYSNPALISRDFRPLSREEHTKYGFIDVFGYDGENNLVVVECKRYAADLKAVDQLSRYVKKVRQLRGIDVVRGILAAPLISANTLNMLSDHGFEYRKITPPRSLERFNKGQRRLDDY